MKNNLFFIAIIWIIVAGCGKHRYCADCVDHSTGYRADVYCAPKEAVDTYVEGLESSVFSDWDCVVTKD